jgi:hypothetical protein
MEPASQAGPISIMRCTEVQHGQDSYQISGHDDFAFRSRGKSPGVDFVHLGAQAKSAPRSVREADSNMRMMPLYCLITQTRISGFTSACKRMGTR